MRLEKFITEKYKREPLEGVHRLTINKFSDYSRKRHTKEYLQSIVDKVNEGYGYVGMCGNDVVFNKYTKHFNI